MKRIYSHLFLAILLMIGMSFSNSSQALRTLASSAKAFSVEHSFSSWGIKNTPENGSINVVPAWKNFEKKKEVIVAVVDTGIDPEHTFIKDNLYFPQGSVNAKQFGFDFSSTQASTTPLDDHGHGTNVAGIIKSIFPEVRMIPLKYFSPKSSPESVFSAALAALEKAVDLGVDVINYSGGGPGMSLAELKILKKAQDKGIIIVAAAGNEHSDIDDSSKAYFPASYHLPNIITVGAYDSSMAKLYASNWGKKTVDIMAPGKNILSAFTSLGMNPNRNLLAERNVAYVKNNLDGKTSSQMMSGTSQATAFVTGVVALLKAQHPHLGYQQIREIILESAKKENTFSDLCISGGRLDAGKAMELAKTKYAPKVVIAKK
ncbi:MAG: S8 family serine peptidase [Bacteriovoracaceae bacterium]|nr:S8 family serine peptidase [Bacteriovoracaceae bacterium]